MPPSSREASPPDEPGRRRILFAKLGSFSHTNDQLLAQLSARFPRHDIVTFDVRDYIKRRLGAVARNVCLEILNFGPLVLKSPADRNAFFFRTPYMFRTLSDAIHAEFGKQANAFDFTFQTQGMFSADLPGRPFVIYTDYTVASGHEQELGDERPPRMPTAFLTLESELYRRADKILVTADHVKRTLVSHYGCAPERVKSIMIGANVNVVPAETGLDRYAAGRILFVGIDWERKGGPTLVAAFEKVAERFPNVTLTIVGCAPPVSHPRVKVLGQIARNRVAEHFTNASIFCLPSLVEPSAVASVEAMSFGLPVIATKVGGFPEIVQDGETGLLVPTRDVPALAEALSALLSNPARARAMGLAGHERSRLFTWDAVGTRLYAETRTFTERQLNTHGASV